MIQSHLLRPDTLPTWAVVLAVIVGFVLLMWELLRRLVRRRKPKRTTEITRPRGGKSYDRPGEEL